MSLILKSHPKDTPKCRQHSIINLFPQTCEMFFIGCYYIEGNLLYNLYPSLTACRQMCYIWKITELQVFWYCKRSQFLRFILYNNLGNSLPSAVWVQFQLQLGYQESGGTFSVVVKSTHPGLARAEGPKLTLVLFSAKRHGLLGVGFMVPIWCVLFFFLYNQSMTPEDNSLTDMTRRPSEPP